MELRKLFLLVVQSFYRWTIVSVEALPSSNYFEEVIFIIDIIFNIFCWKIKIEESDFFNLCIICSTESLKNTLR